MPPSTCQSKTSLLLVLLLLSCTFSRARNGNERRRGSRNSKFGISAAAAAEEEAEKKDDSRRRRGKCEGYGKTQQVCGENKEIPTTNDSMQKWKLRIGICYTLHTLFARLAPTQLAFVNKVSASELGRESGCWLG